MKLRTTALIGLASAVLTATGCAPTRPKEKAVLKDTRKLPEPPKVSAARAVAIDTNLRAEAIKVLEAEFAAPGIRKARAIEAISRAGLPSTPVLVKLALDDPSPVARFAAAMAAGRLKIGAVKPQLVKLANDPAPSVRIAVRFALHQLGDTRLSHDLEAFARDFDPQVRGNAALALGLIGEPSAMLVLRPMLKDINPNVRLQAAEALWRYGSEEGLEFLKGGLISGFEDDVMYSLTALSVHDDPRIRPLIAGKLVLEHDQVSLAAAAALGTLGSDEGYGVAMAKVKDNEPQLRVLAAAALGTIGRPDVQPTLAKLLKDSDPAVRFVAAAAVCQLKAPIPQ